MKEGTSINKSVWWATLASGFLYFITGMFGGMGAVYGYGQDLLSALSNLPTDNAALSMLAKVTSFAYPLITIVSGIPIYSLIVRYNLIDSGLCKKNWANFWGVILPWIISLPFYSGNGLNIVINWTSLLFNAVINFAIPLIFYLRMMQLKHYGLLHKLKLPSKIVRPYPISTAVILDDQLGTDELPSPKPAFEIKVTPPAAKTPASSNLSEWSDESTRLLRPGSGAGSDDEYPSSRLKQFFSTPVAILPKYFSIAPSIQSKDDTEINYPDEDDFIDPVESDEELVDLGYFHPFPHRFRRRVPWFKPWIFSCGLLVTICVLNLYALVLAIIDAAQQSSRTCC